MALVRMRMESSFLDHRGYVSAIAFYSVLTVSPEHSLCPVLLCS